MSTQEIDMEKIDQYSLAELQEYVRRLEHPEPIKRCFEVRKSVLWISGLILTFSLITMVPLATYFNSTNFIVVFFAFVALTLISSVVVFLVHKLFNFIAARFEIKIT